MRATILKDHLVQALSTIERGVGNTSQLPILKNVLIETDQDQLVFTATNLDLALRASVAAKVEASGKITVPLATFTQIIQAVGEDRISLGVEGGQLAITTDQYDGLLATMPAEDFPGIPVHAADAPTLTISKEVLRDALNQVTFGAQQTPDVTPELHAVYFSYAVESLTLACTDSFRLAERVIDAGDFETTLGGAQTFLMPLKTAIEIARNLTDSGEVVLFVEQHQITAETDRWQCVSRLINGNFPNYEQIIPTSFTADATVSRTELIQALKVVSVVANKNNEVHFSVTDKSGDSATLTLTATQDAVGKNTVRIPITTTGVVTDVVFNWRYVTDGLKALTGDTVVFGLNEERPAVLRSLNEGSYRYLIAPLIIH